MEAETAEQAAANADKAAAKQAKKEKLRQEAALRRERLKKDKGESASPKDKSERTSDTVGSDALSEGSDEAPKSRRGSSEPTGSREEPTAA